MLTRGLCDRWFHCILDYHIKKHFSVTKYTKKFTREWYVALTLRDRDPLHFLLGDIHLADKRNQSPGLKVNRSINFSSIKMFFTAYVLCSLSLVKLKSEGQTV